MPAFNFSSAEEPEALCPDTEYFFKISCENADSEIEVTVIDQPIGANAVITQLNPAGDFSIVVDTAGTYELNYCCRYDA